MTRTHSSCQINPGLCSHGLTAANSLPSQRTPHPPHPPKPLTKCTGGGATWPLLLPDMQTAGESELVEQVVSLCTRRPNANMSFGAWSILFASLLYKQSLLFLNRFRSFPSASLWHGMHPCSLFLYSTQTFTDFIAHRTSQTFTCSSANYGIICRCWDIYVISHYQQVHHKSHLLFPIIRAGSPR